VYKQADAHFIEVTEQQLGLGLG